MTTFDRHSNHKTRCGVHPLENWRELSRVSAQRIIALAVKLQSPYCSQLEKQWRGSCLPDLCNIFQTILRAASGIGYTVGVDGWMLASEIFHGMYAHAHFVGLALVLCKYAIDFTGGLSGILIQFTVYNDDCYNRYLSAAIILRLVANFGSFVDLALFSRTIDYFIRYLEN